METALGHRLSNIHIAPDPDNRRGIYHVEAWSYLDAASIEDACVFVLGQVSKVARPINQTWSLNLAPDPLNDQLISYYWDAPEQLAMPEFLSSGVLLSGGLAPESPAEDGNCKPNDAVDDVDEKSLELWQEIGDIVHRSRIDAAPVIDLPGQQDRLLGFTIDYDVEIYSPTKAKLLAVHLPDFCKRWFAADVEVIEIATRSGEKGPFKIRLQQILPQLSETGAIAHCLRWYGGYRIKLDSDKRGQMILLSGRIANRETGANAIVAYELKASRP